MLQGRLIAESCKPGVDIQVPDLRLVRFGRHDVTDSTMLADEREDSSTEASAIALVTRPPAPKPRPGASRTGRRHPNSIGAETS